MRANTHTRTHTRRLARKRVYWARRALANSSAMSQQASCAALRCARQATACRRSNVAAVVVAASLLLLMLNLSPTLLLLLLACRDDQSICCCACHLRARRPKRVAAAAANSATIAARLCQMTSSSMSHASAHARSSFDRPRRRLQIGLKTLFSFVVVVVDAVDVAK